MNAKMTQSVFGVLTKCSSFFKQGSKNELLQTELDFMGGMLKPIENSPEDVVIDQGDEDTCLYFVIKGILQV